MKYLNYKYWLFFLVIISFISLSIWVLFSNLPKPWNSRLEYSVEVVDRNKQLLRLFTTMDGYWRFPLDVKTADKRFISALINYEDQRFYQHSGVDFLAIFRAVRQLLTASHIISGASTISMQTIRLLTPRPRTIKNKLLEMIQAIRMESDLSKNKILSLYLTLAPYGGNIQGVEAASFFYFGKNASFLTNSEIALLIALPQSPENRRPDRYIKRAMKTRNKVLSYQLNKQLIDKEDYLIAIKQAIPTKRQQVPFLIPHLSQRLHQHYPSRGTIYTSIELPFQTLVKQKVKQYYHRLMKGSNYSGQSIAVMVVKNKTREVVAHIGSVDFFKDTQIDLTQIIRSPGSTLKPFIYGLGFQKKLFHPLTKVMDKRYRYSDGYAPENFNQQYLGEVTIEQSLLKSLNIPAVKALNLIGVQRFLQHLKSLGINLFLQKGSKAGLGIALGGIGLNLETLVTMYAGLANGGEYQKLVYLVGDTIAKNQSVKKRLLSINASEYLDTILKKMPQADISKNTSIRGKIRYKTGTSYGYRDAWSIGYNDQYTIGVWIGRVDGGFTHQQTGHQIATPLLQELLYSIPKNQQSIGKYKIRVNEYTYQYNQLPKQMRWLGNNDQNLPHILFPLDGSQIEIKDKYMQLTLKARGGVSPYFWMVNGKYIKQQDSLVANKNEGLWQVSEGKHKITLIDSFGRQSYSWIDILIDKN